MASLNHSRLATVLLAERLWVLAGELQCHFAQG